MMVKKIGFSVVIILLFHLHSAFAYADESPAKICLDEKSVKYALSQYTLQDVDENNEVIKTYSEKDSCDTGIFRTIILGLDFLKNTPDKPVPGKMNMLVNKEGPENFFKKRINIIQFDTRLSDGCSKYAAGYVLDEEKENHIMHICPAMRGNSPLAVATILIHEARHIDGFKHIVCTHGFFSTPEKEACDQSVEEQGSYGTQLAYTYQVYYGTKNKEVKESARHSIISDSLNHFNTAPLGMVKGGIFIDEEDSVSFYDGEQEYRLGTFNDSIAALTISITDSLPVIFFKNGKITKYDFTRNWLLRKGKLADNYNKLSQKERDSLLDVLISNKEYCFLLPELIKCINKTNDIVSLSLPHIKPIRFWNEYLIDEGNIRILSETGNIFLVPPSTKFETSSETDATLESKIFHFPDATSYVETEKGRIIGVSAKGTMVAKKNRDAPWEPAKEFGKYKFKKIIPFYWSKKLEDL